MGIIVGNFLEAVAVVLGSLLTLYMYIIIARAILSWVNPDPYNPIVRFIHNITEPVLYRIREKLPMDFGGVDISPIIVIFAIVFIDNFIVASLHNIARNLIIG
ncbi:MAG: YggT family protein [Proteobacteria bacterium]|nr:YggT family protein [Pseudomonadota bacterium]